MSVYIKGMKMPISCEKCPMLDWDLDYIKCKITGRHFKMTECWRSIRVPDCPLVPVPPHGRLGDLDEAIKRIPIPTGGVSMRDIYENFEFFLANLPTVIPAEEGET